MSASAAGTASLLARAPAGPPSAFVLPLRNAGTASDMRIGQPAEGAASFLPRQLAAPSAIELPQRYWPPLPSAEHWLGRGLSSLENKASLLCCFHHGCHVPPKIDASRHDGCVVWAQSTLQMLHTMSSYKLKGYATSPWSLSQCPPPPPQVSSKFRISIRPP